MYKVPKLLRNFCLRTVIQIPVTVIQICHNLTLIGVCRRYSEIHLQTNVRHFPSQFSPLVSLTTKSSTDVSWVLSFPPRPLLVQYVFPLWYFPFGLVLSSLSVSEWDRRHATLSGTLGDLPRDGSSLPPSSYGWDTSLSTPSLHIIFSLGFLSLWFSMKQNENLLCLVITIALLSKVKKFYVRRV